MKKEPHLEIYKDRSVLVYPNGTCEVFYEGRPSKAATKRYEQIRLKLKDGWFEKTVQEVLSNPGTILPLPEEDTGRINTMVQSISSEYGRALVGLLIVQLVVKSLAKEQSIRLHKGGRSQFSWAEGISMRTIDSQYITPILRKYNLLLVNSYGVFMTRSLAENYPYTPFYKASIRGCKNVWLELVDRIETKQLEPHNALKYILACLVNRSKEFSKIVDIVLEKLESLSSDPSLASDTVLSIIQRHIGESAYSARLLEVAIHSFLQVLDAQELLPGKLLPLCQMRTANKKHRNIADVEIISPTNEQVILEAWDAKYGKYYLRDELEEIREKLEMHPEIQRVGFIVDKQPDLREEIVTRMEEISEETGAEIHIFSFEEWFRFYTSNPSLSEEVKNNLPAEWLRAYTESLCLRRQVYAPIEEPAEQWVNDLNRIFSEYIDNPENRES